VPRFAAPFALTTSTSVADPGEALARNPVRADNVAMLLRILDIHVRPDRVAEWLRFTRDQGFPGMLRQPGCRSIQRLRVHGTAADFRVMTLWDSPEHLERFRASADMRDLTLASAGFTEGHSAELLFDVIDDPAG
jgi:quinol monooxygenase YgiN